jgi:hypothetical protein
MKPQLPSVAAVFAFGMVFRVLKRPFLAPGSASKNAILYQIRRKSGCPRPIISK